MPFEKGHPPYSNYRIPKGHIPWNKGIKVDRSKYPNMGHFQKGSKAWNKGLKGVQVAWNKGMIGLNSGKNNPSWRGGVTNQNHLDRVRFQKFFQKLVFERDNYKCVLCGESGELHIDHIKSWSKYVKLRFEMSNCRTLCKSCHYLITFKKPIPNKNLPWGRNLIGRRVLQ